jgi:hypothetical protein
MDYRHVICEKYTDDEEIVSNYNVSIYVLCLYRGGFPHAPRPFMVYCTSPMDIQTAAIRTHRASPLVPPTREQRN